MKNLKNLYNLAVCFVSAMVLFCYINSSMTSIVNLIFPSYKYKSDLTYFSSIYDFIPYHAYDENLEFWDSFPKDKEKEKKIIEKMKRKRASYILKQSYHIQKNKRSRHKKFN